MLTVSTSTSASTEAVKSAAKIPTPDLRERHFDPWQSVSTGHQKDGDNRLAGSTSWRQSRTAKLAAQFRGGPGGGPRVVDGVGSGSPSFGQDGRTANGGWQRGASGLRAATGCADIAEMLKGSGSGVIKPRNIPSAKTTTNDGLNRAEKRPNDDSPDVSKRTDQTKTPRKVFDGLCFYINGSTAPTVSDHRLKKLIAENGGRIAIGLARKSVTHVVLGRSSSASDSGPSNDPHARTSVTITTTTGAGAGTTTGNSSRTSAGCGGGLSASKLQKEIQRIGGQAVKYVTAEWVLESLKTGRRVPESTAFAKPILFTSSNAQKTLTGMFNKVPAG